MLSRKNADGKTEYLFQKRQNSGFADGMWEFSASGHVEKDESMAMTACREAKEEIGINVGPEDIEFMGLLHSSVDGTPRLLGCFKINHYTGDIKIGEPEKVAELKWFNSDELPDNLIDTRRVILDRYKKGGIFYQEYGWEQEEKRPLSGKKSMI